jgi:hypothetical protein
VDERERREQPSRTLPWVRRFDLFVFAVVIVGLLVLVSLLLARP